MSTQDVLAAMATLYYDLTSATHPTALDGLLRVTTPDHLLFGSDFPFAPADLIPGAKAAIDAAARKAVAHDTAGVLFTRLAARM
jgi:6-methylsalicylate decarboxylase